MLLSTGPARCQNQQSVIQSLSLPAMSHANNTGKWRHLKATMEVASKTLHYTHFFILQI